MDAKTYREARAHKSPPQWTKLVAALVAFGLVVWLVAAAVTVAMRS